MARSLSGSSRSYPGRPERQAVQLTLDSVLHGNMEDDRSGVSRGHSRCRTSPKVDRRLETSSVNRKAGRFTPLKGRT